jgi:MoxR-like ATPase
MFALDRDLLVKIRGRSLRRRVLYRALSRLERSILDLTIRCVEKVRSQVLFDALMNMVSKLSEALKSRFLSRVEEVGRPLARRMSIIAQSLGYRDASEWGDDPSFIRYLGVKALNTCKIYV